MKAARARVSVSKSRRALENLFTRPRAEIRAVSGVYSGTELRP
jgi:hypothetical protein